MKKLFFTIILLSTIFSNAQDSYILKKDGTKIEIDGNHYHYMSFKKIRYTLLEKKGTEFVKGIDIDEVEKLVAGEITYIPYEITKNKKKATGFFKIVAESNDKMLLVSFNPTESRFIYAYKIINKQTQTVLEEGTFVETRFSKGLADQQKAIADIKKHFSNCPEIMNSLSEFEKTNYFT